MATCFMNSEGIEDDCIDSGCDNYSSENVTHREENEHSSSDKTDRTYIADENRLGVETDQVKADKQIYGL